MTSRFNLPWTITVSDGVNIRSINAQALPAKDRDSVCALLNSYLFDNAPEKKAADTHDRPLDPPSVMDTKTQVEIARAQGFEGQACNCGSFNTKRNGSCLVCTSCGSTTGCS